MLYSKIFMDLLDIVRWRCDIVFESAQLNKLCWTGCWIQRNNFQRIGLQYLWIWLAAFLTVVVYIFLALVVKRIIILDGNRIRWPSFESRSQSSSDSSNPQQQSNEGAIALRMLLWVRWCPRVSKPFEFLPFQLSRCLHHHSKWCCSLDVYISDFIIGVAYYCCPLHAISHGQGTMGSNGLGGYPSSVVGIFQFNLIYAYAPEAPPTTSTTSVPFADCSSIYEHIPAAQ